MTKPTVKNRFSKSEKVVSPVGVTPALQQFKDDADINSIMRRFQKTGAIDHVAKHQPEYGYATSTTLHEAMNIVSKAQSMFSDLPSQLRRKFNGDAQELLDFVQNPANAVEAEQLGLALSDKAAAAAAAIAADRAAAEAVAQKGDGVSGEGATPKAEAPSPD